MMLSPVQTLVHDEAARSELARRRAPNAVIDIFSPSWSELLVTPSQTLKSSPEQANQEFEVTGSLTEANFSVSLRKSANEHLTAIGEALEAPVLSSAAVRLRDAARYVDEKLAEDRRRQEFSTAA